MTIRKIIVLCMSFAIVLGLCACSGEKEMKKVSDLAYDEADSINYIYIMENVFRICKQKRVFFKNR